MSTAPWLLSTLQLHSRRNCFVCALCCHSRRLCSNSRRVVEASRFRGSGHGCPLSLRNLLDFSMYRLCCYSQRLCLFSVRCTEKGVGDTAAPWHHEDNLIPKQVICVSFVHDCAATPDVCILPHSAVQKSEEDGCPLILRNLFNFSMYCLCTFVLPLPTFVLIPTTLYRERYKGHNCPLKFYPARLETRNHENQPHNISLILPF